MSEAGPGSALACALFFFVTTTEVKTGRNSALHARRRSRDPVGGISPSEGRMAVLAIFEVHSRQGLEWADLQRRALTAPKVEHARCPDRSSAVRLSAIREVPAGCRRGARNPVHRVLPGCMRCNSVQQSRSSHLNWEEHGEHRRYGLLSISMHLENARCSGVGERTRTSTPY